MEKLSVTEQIVVAIVVIVILGCLLWFFVFRKSPREAQLFLPSNGTMIMQDKLSDIPLTGGGSMMIVPTTVTQTDTVITPTFNGKLIWYIRLASLDNIRENRITGYQGHHTPPYLCL